MSSAIKGVGVPGIPAGYEMIAYRKAEEGEQWLDALGRVRGPEDEIRDYHSAIVRKIQVWRSPRLDDLKDGPAKCRLQDGHLVSLRAIDVHPGTRLPFFVNDTNHNSWVTFCEIQAD